jgi:hypothetical protein
MLSLLGRLGQRNRKDGHEASGKPEFDLCSRDQAAGLGQKRSSSLGCYQPQPNRALASGGLLSNVMRPFSADQAVQISGC